MRPCKCLLRALKEERKENRARKMAPTGIGGPDRSWHQARVPWSQVSQGQAALAGDRGTLVSATAWSLTQARPAAAGRTNSRSQSLRSTDARRREELGDELQQFGFPSSQTGEDKNAVRWGRLVPRD